eukprot:scaffold330_cov109-Isochrysis_galbana.AAC.1
MSAVLRRQGHGDGDFLNVLVKGKREYLTDATTRRCRVPSHGQHGHDDKRDNAEDSVQCFLNSASLRHFRRSRPEQEQR